MAQNIDLLGAQYSDVPAVELPKVGGGTASFTDVTDTTAAAADVAQGKYFYTAAGVRTEGTSTGGGGTEAGTVTQDQDGYLVLNDEAGSSVTVEALLVTQNGTYTAPTGTAYSPVTVNVSGGGGLEYESGTWTPTSDIANYTVQFSKTHSSLPIFAAIYDETGDYSSTNNSMAGWFYFDFYQLFGEAVYPSSSSHYYGYARRQYRTTNASSFTSSGSDITYPYTNTGTSSASYPRYWVSESGLEANSGSTTRYWEAGRTYKWIAVWKPTS